MSVTKFCILVTILSDCRHFHSSLEALASPKEAWDIRKAWIKSSVKLVSFRHSKFYFSNTKSSQFTSYEPRVNKETTWDSPRSSSDSLIYLHDHHPRNQKDVQDVHEILSPDSNFSKSPSPNSRNYLITPDAIYSHKPDFLQFSALPGLSPLNTDQEGYRNGSKIQDWKNEAKKDTRPYGRNASSVSSIINSTALQNPNSSTSMSIGPSNHLNLTDRERSESGLYPHKLPFRTKIIPKNMPTSASELPSVTLTPSSNWINATDASTTNQELDKAMNFYGFHSSQEEQFIPGKHTLSKPLLGLQNAELNPSRLSTFINLSSMSKQMHLNRDIVNRYSFMYPMALKQQSIGEQKLNPNKKRSDQTSKQDDITNKKYFLPTSVLMNYSIGDIIENEDVPRIKVSKGVVRSTLGLSSDTSNSSFLLSQTLDGDMNVQNFLTTPAYSEINETNEDFKGTENARETLVTTSLPKPQVDVDKRSELIKNFKSKYPVKVWAAVGFYDDSYLETINSHWLQFEPADPIVHKILAILYGIIMVIGCGGNLLVIVMFFRCRSLRTPPNYLIVNLAVSDFFMMVKMPIFIYNSLYQGPALGVTGCKIYGFVGGLTGTASIMTLATIALDRYYVIVYPMNPLKRTTSTRAILMMTAVWLYSALFASVPLFGVNDYVPEGFLTSCSFDYLSDKTSDRIFVAIFFVAAFILPLSIIVFSYTRIFQMVRAAERVEFFSPGSVNGGPLTRESFKYKHDKKKIKTEFKIAKLASAIILIWLLAWTPYAIIALLGIFGYKELVTPFVSTLPGLFCKGSALVNPFLYAINHPRFQRELKNKFKFCYSHPKRSNSAETSYYSNTCKENSDNSGVDLKRKPSPIASHGSPECRDSVKSPRYNSNKTSITINLKGKDSSRFAKLSRSSPVLDKNVTYNLQENLEICGGNDETNVIRSKNKKVEILVVGKAHQGHISSTNKKQQLEETAYCDYKNKGESLDSRNLMLCRNNSTHESETSPIFGTKDTTIEDSRDLRRNDVVLRNKKLIKLSSSESTTYTGICGNDIIVNYKIFNGKSLSADSTSRTSKMETTIM